MLSCEGIGKNIEKAIEDALFKLKAPREDVDIKILEEGGLFKKAKVLVSIAEDSQQKYINKNEKVKLTKDDNEEEKLDIKKLLTESDESLLTNKVKSNKIEKTISIKTQPETQLIKDEEEYKELNDKFSLQSSAFLKKLLSIMEVDSTIIEEELEDKITISVLGKYSGNIIGYRGECLNALQYLINVISSKKDNIDKKIVLDVENYREKREEALIQLAQRMARKVAKTRHQIKLEPMNSNERRIIHTTLQNDTFVTTFSKGNEPNRYLVIAPNKNNNEQNT